MRSKPPSTAWPALPGKSHFELHSWSGFEKTRSQVRFPLLGELCTYVRLMSANVRKLRLLIRWSLVRSQPRSRYAFSVSLCRDHRKSRRHHPLLHERARCSERGEHHQAIRADQRPQSHAGGDRRFLNHLSSTINPISGSHLPASPRLFEIDQTARPSECRMMRDPRTKTPLRAQRLLSKKSS
jgi:hypothetical protein